jgi:hypothetical protein
MVLLLASITISIALIALLGIGDPKRRRTSDVPGKGYGTTKRRLLAVAACAPGVLWMCNGDAAALLIWLGASSVAGWFLTMLLAHVKRTVA